jgi:glycosyltransferase involved in cell wall biosynthesis
MTKIVHIQYSTESAGGAALRLQRAFVKADIQSDIVSLQMDSPPVDQIKYLNRKSKTIAWLDTKLQSFLTKKVDRKFGLYSYPFIGTNITSIKELKNADIIYLHWVLNGFLSMGSLSELASLNKPVVIFMHDMWSMSGGCHYSFDCENFKTDCHNCQMFPDSVKGLPAKEFQKKQDLYKTVNNFYFISPSKWLYNCAKQSFLLKDKPVFYIPNLLDDTIFKPCDKKIAKKILNIDENETIIAFGAVSISSPYKGWTYLQQSLTLLKEKDNVENITILIFGSGYNHQIASSIPFKIKFMDYLYDEYSTAIVFNAADVFIAPSLAEAFGYVVFEALNCGTPVVGFNVGGIPDMIRHKENGYLAKYKDAEDIAEGVMYCLENKIKGFIPAELEHDLTIKKHLELFEHINAQQNELTGKITNGN